MVSPLTDKNSTTPPVLVLTLSRAGLLPFSPPLPFAKQCQKTRGLTSDIIFLPLQSAPVVASYIQTACLQGKHVDHGIDESLSITNSTYLPFGGLDHLKEDKIQQDIFFFDQ